MIGIALTTHPPSCRFIIDVMVKKMFYKQETVILIPRMYIGKKKIKQHRRSKPCLYQDTELYSHVEIDLEEKSPEASNQGVRKIITNIQK